MSNKDMKTRSKRAFQDTEPVDEKIESQDTEPVEDKDKDTDPENTDPKDTDPTRSKYSDNESEYNKDDIEEWILHNRPTPTDPSIDEDFIEYNKANAAYLTELYVKKLSGPDNIEMMQRLTPQQIILERGQKYIIQKEMAFTKSVMEAHGFNESEILSEDREAQNKYIFKKNDNILQQSVISTIPIKVIDEWSYATRQILRNNLSSARASRVPLNRYEIISVSAMVELEMYFRNSASPKLSNHRDLSDTDFCNELDRILGGGPHSMDSDDTLAHNLSKCTYAFDINMTSVISYTNQLITILQISNSGDLQNFNSHGGISLESVIKILIKNLYNPKTYKGLEKYRNVTRQFQEHLKVKYSQFKCPNLEHFVDDLYAMTKSVIFMRSQLINMGILTSDSTKNTNTSTSDSTSKDNKRSRDDLKFSSSRFTKQPNNTTTTTTNSTSKDNTNYPRCTGCGSFHGGNEKTCLAREHPDFNKSKVTFEDTTIGKHYRDRGKSSIDFHKRWDGLTETFIPYAFKKPPREGSSSHGVK